MTDPNSENRLDWRDGDMPYSLAFGDHFYCQTDGRLECGYVFLGGNGLPDRWRGRDSFRIGELGFGTGLNFCETWRQWQDAREPGAHLHFVSFELYPMSRDEIGRALSRWPEIGRERQALTAAWPERPEGIVSLDLDSQTRLAVVCGPALEGVRSFDAAFDAWYLDGFAPSRNGDMWSLDLMRELHGKTAGRPLRHLCGGRFRAPEPRGCGLCGGTAAGLCRKAGNALRRKTRLKPT